MDYELTLTVPGEPMGKQRPRRASNIRGTYTPQKTLNYETLIKELFIIKYPDFKPIEGAVEISIGIYLTIPKSKSKKKQEEMAMDTIKALKNPDVDNVLKIVMDALEGLAYRNDNQVVTAHPTKRWSNTPRIDIKIQDVENVPWKFE